MENKEVINADEPIKNVSIELKVGFQDRKVNLCHNKQSNQITVGTC